MTRLWPQGEEISVFVDHQGRPIEFRWQHRRYRLQHIQQRWQVDTDWWDENGRVWHEYFAVTSTDGRLWVLYQDLLTQSWYLSKLYD